MACSEHGRRALADRALLERVVEHKRVYFASGWAHYETAATGGLRLVPPEGRRKEIARDYEGMRDYLYGSSPKLDEIISELGCLEEQINS